MEIKRERGEGLGKWERKWIQRVQVDVTKYTFKL